MSQESFLIQEPSPRQRKRAGRFALTAAIVLALGFGIGSIRVFGVRSAQAEALRKSTASQQQVFVVFTTPKPAGADGSAQMELPGTLIGQRDTAVYARASGYVKRWTHDIGTHVQKGEVLAEIETPELDRQIEQAQANVRLVGANLDLARTSLKRWEDLRKDALVTEQELEERRSAVTQFTASQAAAQAELARLQNLRGFEKVEAPFAGTVTRRNVEIGKLVNAGATGADQALFEISSTDVLRLEIAVPQAYATHVRSGMPIMISQAERPGETFAGHVARTSGAIDATSRTLQVEVEIPNPHDTLLPGTYVQARLALPQGKLLAVPANTLLFRAEGPRLALLDKDGRIHLQAITLGRDLGKTIEVLTGLQPTDHVVLNPPDALGDGDVVDAHAAPAAPAPAQAAK